MIDKSLELNSKQNFNKIIFIFLVALFFSIDQFSKWLARKYLIAGTIEPLIPNFIDLILIQNKGISYGSV